MSDFREYAGVDFATEFLAHYGVGHDKGGHSGRYPWGSGEKAKYRRKLDEIPEAKSRKKVAKYYTKRLRKLESQRLKNHDEYFNSENLSKRKQKKILKKTDQWYEETIDTIKELSRNGYGINSKTYTKDVSKGKRIVKALFTGTYTKAWYHDLPAWKITVKETYENDNKNDNIELARTFGSTDDVREVKEAIMESRSRRR